MNYKVIKGQEKRTSNYTLQPDEDPIDDSHLPASFYRFDSQTGNDIVNEEQAMFQCGTKFPIYMIGMFCINTKCVTLKFSHIHCTILKVCIISSA